MIARHQGVFVIAQARLGSTRLPGKVMMPLAGKPIVTWVMDRASRAAVEGTILAIPDRPEEEVLVQLGRRQGYRVHRGEGEDVQARFLSAARAAGAHTIVRLTCDNPLVDHVLINRLVAGHLESNADYSSFGMAGPFPIGLSVEAFSAEALVRARQVSDQEFHREHVTPAFYLNPDRFKLTAVEPPSLLRRADLRLTVDTREDYDALSRLVSLFEGRDPLTISAEEYVEALLQHEEIRAINAGVHQKQLGE